MNAVKTIAQGFVILTLGPVLLVWTAVITMFTVCCWGQDDVGCPIAPPVITVPIHCLFGQWLWKKASSGVFSYADSTKKSLAALSSLVRKADYTKKGPAVLFPYPRA